MEDSAAPPPPPAPPPPGERPLLADLPFLVAAAVALVACLVLLRNLLPAKQDLVETVRERERLEKDIRMLERERDRLAQEEKALLGDERYLERVHRKQTGMTRPGEFIVR